jgi:imidazolonepropionase-like amidohydrolase
MKRHLTRHTLLGALLLASSSLMAQDTPVAIRGAKLIPVSGPEIENGVLVVHRGKITAIGGSGTAIPRNARIIDGRGKVVMPGLVDTHSHVGGGDGGDGSAAQHPDVRIVDAINPRSDTFNKARAGGITTVNVMPGSGHLLSGQTAYLKLRANPRRIEDLLVNRSLEGIYGGIKMANGTNSLRAGGGTFPATRGRSALMQRNLFIKAQEYQKKMRDAGDDASKKPARDLQMETMVEVLEGKRIVHYHTHTHYDILTVLRLKEEFGFRVVLHHVSDAWAVADEIAAAGVASSIIHIDAPGGKLETMNITPENGAALERAGADFGYHTDDGITDSRVFLRSAAFGMRSGVSRAKALEAMTLAGARMLDLQDRVGSLDVGKDADFIILNGDPFSVYTRIEQTWVEGDKVFDFSDPVQRGFATGGLDVFRETNVHVACEH